MKKKDFLMDVLVVKQWEDFHLKAKLEHLNDAFLFFLTDQEKFGLGTIIAGVPSPNEPLLKNESSIPLLGTKNLILSRIIVQILCKKFQKPIIGFLDLRTQKPESKIGKEVKEIVESVIQKYEEAEKKENSKLKC